MKYQLRLAITLVALAVASAASAGQIALPTTLDKLLPVGDFAVVGDLVFDEFAYSWGGNMPDPVQISVVAINNGIEFVGPFLDLPGGEGNGASDARILYTVTGPGISQVSLSANPDLLGATGNASITEDFLNIPDIKLNSFDKPSEGIFKSFDSAGLGGTFDRVEVRKDILLFTDDDIISATLSSVRQEFTPEPSSLMLSVLGLLGFALRRRR